MTFSPTAEFQDSIASVISQFQSNHLDQALRAATHLSTLYPDAPILLNVTGAIMTNQGNWRDAIDIFRECLRLDPEYAQAYNNLGIAQKAGNRPEDALASYRHAYKLKPDLDNAYLNEAELLQDMGRADQAIMAYETALKLRPELTGAHRKLLQLFSEQDQFEKAVEHGKAILSRQPDDVNILNDCGAILTELKNWTEARAYFKKALQLDPRFANPMYNLGKIAHELGQNHDALEYFEAAIATNPGYVAAFVNAGVVNLELDNKAQAHLCYKKALEFEPDNCLVHHGLSQITKYQADDPHLTQMRNLIATPDLPDVEREYLGFALAKALDDVGDIASSFETLAKANDLHKSLNPFSITQKKTLFTAIQSKFATPTKSQSPAPQSTNATKIPIFILGMPRSGTSLTEQILASHSAVHGAGEISAFDTALNPRAAGIPGENWGSQLVSLDIEKPEDVRHSYLTALEGLDVPEHYITDKMPLNFRWIGFILQALPEAHILHVHRSPIATCWSSYQRRYRHAGIDFAYGLKDLADYYHLYQSVMQYWHQKLPGRILDVSYEDLTTDIEQQVRTILDFCGLEWQRDCLNFHNSKRIVKTASSQQVRKKIYQGSSEAWRRYEPYLQTLVSRFT